MRFFISTASLKGDVRVDGAACIDGIVEGSIESNDSSVLALGTVLTRR